jgi:hypothetical protein
MKKNTFNSRKTSYFQSNKFIWILSFLLLSFYSGFSQCDDYYKTLGKLSTHRKLIAKNTCNIQQDGTCTCSFNFQSDHSLSTARWYYVYSFSCDESNITTFSIFKDGKHDGGNEIKSALGDVPDGTAFQVINAVGDDHEYEIVAKFKYKPSKASDNNINVIVVDATD